MKSTSRILKMWAPAMLCATLILFSGCMSGGDMKKTLEAETARSFINDLYQERLNNWPVEYHSQWIPTSFGDTHAIVSGPEDGPVLLLFHAMGFNGLTYAPNAEALSRIFRIYAVDTIGDVGRSIVGEQHPKNLREYAMWVEEIIDFTGKSRAYIAGCSMGGWIAHGAALYLPGRVEKAVLISPAAGIPVKTSWGGMLISMMLNPREANVKKHVRHLLGNHAAAEDWTDYMWHATKLGGEGKLAYPKKLKDQELRHTLPPILLLVGEDEVVYRDIDLVFARAEANLLNVETSLIPRAGHMGHYDNPDYVNHAMISFLVKNGD